MLWIQILLFPLLAYGAYWLGRHAARNKWWIPAVIVPFVLIALLVLGHRWTRASFVPPVSWLVDADFGPPVMTAAIALVFGTLIWKLDRQRNRRAAWGAMLILLINYGLLPAAMPLAVQSVLAATPTRLDPHGVCLQTHGYTCGPAAAVTCLGRLGIQAEEGTLAVASRCGPAEGTDGNLLAAAINEQFPATKCEYVYVDDVRDLCPPVVATMEIPGVGGHYVAVLEIGYGEVVIGDPMIGLRTMTLKDFKSQWTGAVVRSGGARE